MMMISNVMQVLTMLTMMNGVLASTASSSSKIISETNARLPMSLSSVISDLEAEGVSSLTMACLISSRSVTSLQRGELLERMFGSGAGDDDEDEGEAIDHFNVKAFGTDSGLAIAQPPSTGAIYEVASTALACGGNILYYPSPEDLSRGEGLFEGLAPAMERILSRKTKGDKQETTLIVVTDNVEETRLKLESACEAVLGNFVTSQNNDSNGEDGKTNHHHQLSVLEDIFDHVLFCHPSQVVQVLKTSVHEKSSKSPSEAAAAVSACVSSDLLSTSAAAAAVVAPSELAAARKIGPIARKAVSSAIQTVKEATSGGTKLVTEFGSLCDAAIAQAFGELESSSSSSSLSSTRIGKQIQDNLSNELYEELGHLFEEQLELLVATSFDEFKQSLSKLRVSVNLSSEMEDVVTKTIAGFVTKAKQLQIHSKHMSGGATWPFSHVTKKFQNSLQEYCQERLLAAQASGQYKPLPRKGVQVGFHWLLPKPFGNDYRQEPWMVHATDNMVYIPSDKVTDVAMGDIPKTQDGSTSDWRTKIVPSPAGNDMLYMQ